jgi:hypothetical protein
VDDAEKRLTTELEATKETLASLLSAKESELEDTKSTHLLDITTLRKTLEK